MMDPKGVLDFRDPLRFRVQRIVMFTKTVHLPMVALDREMHRTARQLLHPYAKRPDKADAMMDLGRSEDLRNS